MSLRLILMRHAKSDWDTPVGGDFERPLNVRGRASATAIGTWLAQNGYVPDLVLCSPATRTRATWLGARQALPDDVRVKYLPALYLASPDIMLQEVSKISDVATAMLIAHNPGSAILAHTLADRAPPHARFDDYPTAATTVFDFATADWATIRPGSGQVVDFVVPRDLG